MHWGSRFMRVYTFLSQLMDSTPGGELMEYGRLSKGIRYRSARNATYFANHCKDLPIYLARADGLAFSIVEKLS